MRRDGASHLRASAFVSRDHDIFAFTRRSLGTVIYVSRDLFVLMRMWLNSALTVHLCANDCESA